MIGLSTRRLPMHRRSGGFTLLEVLLAFLVFSLSFATVLQILSGSVRNTVRSKQNTEVALIAQSVMDNVGIDIELREGTVVDGEEGDYRWSLEIYGYNGGPGPENEQQQVFSGDEIASGNATEAGALQISEVDGIVLLKVDLFISWGEPPRERSRYFTTVKAMMAGAVQL